MSLIDDIGGHVKAKRTNEAAASIEAYLATAPSNTHELSHLAHLCCKAGLWALAEAPSRRLTELEPEDARRWYVLGMVLRKLRRFDEARQAQGQAIALAPTFDEAVSELSKIDRDRRTPATVSRAPRIPAVQPSDVKATAKCPRCFAMNVPDARECWSCQYQLVVGNTASPVLAPTPAPTSSNLRPTSATDRRAVGDGYSSSGTRADSPRNAVLSFPLVHHRGTKSFLWIAGTSLAKWALFSLLIWRYAVEAGTTNQIFLAALLCPSAELVVYALRLHNKRILLDAEGLVRSNGWGIRRRVATWEEINGLEWGDIVVWWRRRCTINLNTSRAGNEPATEPIVPAIYAMAPVFARSNTGGVVKLVDPFADLSVDPTVAAVALPIRDAIIDHLAMQEVPAPSWWGGPKGRLKEWRVWARPVGARLGVREDGTEGRIGPEKRPPCASPAIPGGGHAGKRPRSHTAVIVAAVLIPVVLVSAAVGRAVLNDPARKYNEGVGAHESGDLQTAIRLYSECLERDPSYAPAHLNLAMALLGYKGTSGLSDGEIEALVNSATYGKTQPLDDAETHLKRAAEEADKLRPDEKLVEDDLGKEMTAKQLAALAYLDLAVVCMIRGAANERAGKDEWTRQCLTSARACLAQAQQRDPTIRGGRLIDSILRDLGY